MPKDSLITPSGVRLAADSAIFSSVTGFVIDAQAAALDLAPCFAVGGDEARLDEGVEHTDAGVKFAARNFNRRQALGERAFLESAARSFCRFIGGVAAVQQRGRFRRAAPSWPR